MNRSTSQFDFSFFLIQSKRGFYSRVWYELYTELCEPGADYHTFMVALTDGSLAELFSSTYEEAENAAEVEEEEDEKDEEVK